MEGLPQELQLTFVDENPPEEWTATDEPDYVVEEIDPPQEVQHLVEEKKPIVLDTIFDDGGDDRESVGTPSPLSRAMGVKKQGAKPVIKKVADPLKPAKVNKNGKPRKKREYTEEQKEALRERLKKAREVSQKNKSKQI
jgi:hypothetical protein